MTRARTDHGKVALREPPTAAELLERIRIETGERADYEALAPWHYRAGPPATLVRVLRAVSAAASGGRGRERPCVLGVLTVSMPTLNSAHRRLAWPGRFDTPDRRLNARRLREEVRTISRVIVDPRVRGVGLAHRLVRAYLERPLTPATEALAAMGGASRFFARAGMTEYTLVPSAHAQRLADALHHARVNPLELLARRAEILLFDARAHASFLEREIRAWANASRATRRHRGDPLPSLARRAALALAGRARAYAHTAGVWRPQVGAGGAGEEPCAAWRVSSGAPMTVRSS
jgi:hypothetical protein